MRLKFTVVAMSIFLAFAAPPVTWAQGDDITALIAEANRHLNGDGVAQDYDAAIAGFGAALKKLDGLSEPRQGDQVVAHNQLGFAYHLTGRYAEAAEQFDAAYRIMTETGSHDPAEVNQVRFNRAIAWRLSGRAQDAVRELADLIPAFEALPEPLKFERRGSLTYHLGMALIVIGERSDGRTVLKQAFDDLVQSATPDFSLLGEIVMSIGGTHLDAGEFREAATEFEKAASILNLAEQKDHQLLASVLTRLGVAKRALGDHEGALEAHGLALTAAKAAFGEKHPLVAEVLSNRGVVYGALDRSGEALADYETALAIYSEAFGGQSAEAADVVFNVAAIHYASGNFAQAIENFEAARVIYEGLDPPDLARTATAYSNLGSVYESLNALDKAKASFERAIALLPPGSRHAIDVRNNRAVLLVRLGQLEEAVKEFEGVIAGYTKASGADSMEVGRTRVNMGVVLKSLGRGQEAIDSAARGLKTIEAALGPKHALAIAAAGDLGYSLLLNAQVEDAFAHIAKVLAAGGEGANRRFALEQLSIYAIALEMPTTSLLFGKLAVNAQQQEMAVNRGLAKDLMTSFTSRFGGVHAGLAERLIDDGLFSEAQYVSSLVKKEEFIAFSRGAARVVAAAGGNEVALTASERKIATRLDEALAPARQALDKAQAVFDQIPAADAKTRSAALAKLDGSLKKTAGAVRKLIETTEAQRATIQAERLKDNARRMAAARGLVKKYNGQAVLYHAVSLDDELHIMVTRADLAQPIHRKFAIKRKELAAKVSGVLAAIEGRAPEALGLLKELDELLIAQVRSDLGAGGSDVVMLDVSGFLRYVPFAALNDGRHFLVEDFALTNFDGAAASGAGAAGDGSAGFGTSLAHGDFPALPGVAKELEAIFKGKDGQGYLDGGPLLDQDFTLAALRGALQKRPRYVHIASHFRFTPGNELGSSLLLGTGEEIAMDRFRTDPGLKFSGVDLLVLSACETARGSGAEGAEIESLGRLAQNNGAAAVMATLWPIADEASARLMADFYRGLVSDGLDKAHALQRAQIAMIRNVDVAAVRTGGKRGAVAVEDGNAETVRLADATAHPYFWSPFVLMGRWQ